MSAPAKARAIVALRIVLRGQVQGVGYRPAIVRLAHSLGLAGWVRNTLEGVEVHIEGTPQNSARFVEQCESVCPQHAGILSRSVACVNAEAARGFRLLQDGLPGPCATTVPRDLVTCADCIAEIESSANRRAGYLMTSCTNCGPRYSITEAMPFERSATAMKSFPMCDACAREYQSPVDRRFHAQTTACPKCGPQLLAEREVIQALSQGLIVAVKGLGGYQLIVDARNAQAIQRLRQRKGRSTKPLAVLVANLAQAEAVAELSGEDRRLLTSAAGPIVIVKQRPRQFPRNVSPGRSTVGLMLPTTPVHHWIATAFGPVIATSGNHEGDPLTFDERAAESLLSGIADRFLHHNRPIRRPIDDSLVRIMANRPVTVRLARGMAPLPLSHVTHTQPSVLAVGGHQKVAVALTNGRQACLGPHIGDLTSAAARVRFVEQVEDLLMLYAAHPSTIVHDLHPDYFTTEWAINRAREHNLRTIRVQHHHAHIVAGMVEQNWLSKSVLGVAWDGTGLGTDGTIWGGEFLLASSTGFRRVAHLRPFRLPGGEAAISQPWRIGTAILRDVRQWDTDLSFSIPRESSIQPWLYESRFSPVTTSAGRLFDAVAAIILPDESTNDTHGYEEGQLATMLEDACNFDADGQYDFPLVNAGHQEFLEGSEQGDVRGEDPTMELDWRPLVASVVREYSSGVPLGDIAMRFHRSLAVGIAQVCRVYEQLPVVLSGGVMQNRVLVELLASELSERSLPVAFPGVIPPNDGGLAAGQLAIALAILEAERKCV